MSLLLALPWCPWWVIWKSFHLTPFYPIPHIANECILGWPDSHNDGCQCWSCLNGWTTARSRGRDGHVWQCETLFVLHLEVYIYFDLVTACDVCALVSQADPRGGAFLTLFMFNNVISIQEGCTALMLAGIGGHAPVVTLLLDLGASVDITDNVSLSS